MREYIKKPENKSRTLDDNSGVFKQVPINEILKVYKNKEFIGLSVQYQSKERQDLPQAKTSGFSSSPSHPIQCQKITDLDDVSQNKITAVLDRFKSVNFDLYFRLEYTFHGIDEMLENEILGLNGSFLSLLHTVLDPSTSEKKVSEDLSELEHIVDLPKWEILSSPIYGGVMSENTHQHGTLPPLEIENMEVDAYYMEAGNILHIDEVKDTPAAFASKAKEGKQMLRHIEWLDKPIDGYKKEIGYYINSSGPKFDLLLDPKIVHHLKLVANKQEYKGLLNVALIEMTPTELEQLMNSAFEHLQADPENRMKKEYYTFKFASYEETLKTLGKL